MVHYVKIHKAGMALSRNGV